MNDRRYRDEHAERPTHTPNSAGAPSELPKVVTLKSLGLPPFTTLEVKIATMLCQFRRVTRDMPSQDEIHNAIPYARSLITSVKRG